LSVSIITVAAFVAAGLLIAAGVAKVLRPLPTARAMYAAGLPGRSAVVRGIGLAEIGVGTWFLLTPSGAAGAALAIMYLAFTSFIAFLLIARPGATSCGCAGASDVPPSLIHLGLNTLAAAAAAAAALDPPAGLVKTLGALDIASVPFVLGLLTAAALCVAAVTDLPPALASYRRPPGHGVETDGSRHVRADSALAAANVGPGHPSLWPGTSGADGSPEKTAPAGSEPDA
jgi:hypothetical protein